MSEGSQGSRRFPRIPSKNTVLVSKDAAAVNGHFTKTRVLGLGGCMFVHDQPVGKDSVLYLSILVGKRLLETKVRVAYEIQKGLEEYEVGVEFLEISPDDLETLKALFEDPPAPEQPG